MKRQLGLGGLAAGIPALFGFFLYSPMLGAKLGLIDDHEFIRFLSTGGRNISAIPAMLETSEIANFGETARFRPAYYSLRALGSVVHGTNGSQWFFFRILFFLLLLVAISLLVQKVSQRVFKLTDVPAAMLAAVTGLLIAGMASWQDIVTRLGPSELYLSLGLVITGWGLWYLATQKLQWLGSVLVTLGFSLAVGSKENSITLLGPLMLALLILFLFGSSKPALVVAAAISTLATTFTAAGFLPTVLSSGEDVYGASRSLSGALGAMVQLWPFWISLAVAVAGTVLSLRGQLGSSRKVLLALLSFSPLLIVLSESYFYQYSISAGGNFGPARYGVIAELTGILSLAFLGMAAFSLRTYPKSSLALPVAVAAIAGLILPLGQLGTSLGYRAFSQANAEYLNVQYQSIEQTANFIKETSIEQVLYIVDEPYDYERISASRQYIEYLSNTESTYFLYTDFSKVQFDQFTAPLAESLQSWSEEGNSEWFLSPLDSLDPESPLICVHFGQNPDPSPCAQSQWIGG